MYDSWTDRLSEYLDGELSSPERVALEQHLRGCESCRAVLVELRAVAVRAGDLEASPPPRDLWPGIARRIGLISATGGSARRALSVPLPALAAGVAAIALASGLVMWKLAVPGGAGGERSQPAVAVAALEPGGGYQVTIGDLERILAEERDRLDTGTVRVLEESLGVIDRAIEEAQRALAADPASLYLSHHLAQTMRLKVDLLRRAVVLARAGL